MSAFDKDAANKAGADDQITEKFLEHLVGDGKKFTDQEALAKGKYESDLHVGNLERQIAELREDIDKGSKIDELMELVRNQQNPPKDQNDSNDGNDDTSPGPMSPEELKALIETHVSERDTQTTELRNVVEVDKALTSKFGEAAGRILNDRAIGLDMSVDEMKVLASKNPKAFYRLMGMDDTRKSDSSTLLGGSQRSEGVPIKNATDKTWAYYQDIRRKDKALYHSPKMQQEIADARVAGGEAFFSNS